MAPQELAVFFHETYERLAPSFGYITRDDTKAFDPLSNNGRLMTAVADAVLERLAADDTSVRAIDAGGCAPPIHVGSEQPRYATLGNVEYQAAQTAALLDEFKNRAVTPVDPRWLALARTQFQTVFMSLRRSLFANRSDTL